MLNNLTSVVNWSWATFAILILAATIILDRVVFAFSNSRQQTCNFILLALSVIPLLIENSSWITLVHGVAICYLLLIGKIRFVVYDYHFWCFWWINTFLFYSGHAYLHEWCFLFQLHTVAAMALPLLPAKTRLKSIFVVLLVVSWTLIRGCWFTLDVYWTLGSNWFTKCFFGSISFAQVALLKNLIVNTI